MYGTLESPPCPLQLCFCHLFDLALGLAARGPVMFKCAKNIFAYNFATVKDMWVKLISIDPPRRALQYLFTRHVGRMRRLAARWFLMEKFVKNRHFGIFAIFQKLIDKSKFGQR